MKGILGIIILGIGIWFGYTLITDPGVFTSIFNQSLHDASQAVVDVNKQTGWIDGDGIVE